jgi:hypothetical protein
MAVLCGQISARQHERMGRMVVPHLPQKFGNRGKITSSGRGHS